MPLAPVPATRIPRSALTFSSAGDIGVRTVGDDDIVGFVAVSVVEDEQTYMWVGGIPDGARVIVQGQDFVREGQKVEPVTAAELTATATSSAVERADVEIDRMSKLHRLRHQSLAADDRDADLPAVRGAGLLCDDPEGGGAGRQDPDHLRPALAARHQPGGCRAAAAAAGRDPAQVGRQRQGDALDRVRGRRLRAARVRGRLRLPSPRSPTCAPRSISAKHDLPRDVDEPQVLEVNLSLYPVLVVGLSGDVPERTLLRIARAAKNAIEQAPGVLSAELRGARDEAVEIIIDPTLMKSYGLSLEQLGQLTQSFNTLIAAGALEGQTGRFAVKVPSLFEKPQDILKVPVIASQTASVTLADIAQIKPTFKDATSVTRVNGRPAMTIEVSKRTGANLIETVDAVKYVVGAAAEDLAGSGPRHLHAGQVEGHPADARRPAELGRDRRAAGRRRDPVRARLPRLAVHRHRDPGVVPRRRARAAARRPDGQHRGAVLAHPRGRHAGRRRHHRVGIRRAPHGRRHAAAGGLFARRQAHVGSGDRRHRDPHRRVLAAAVLAGRGRAVHEISADHADRDAVRLARGRAVLHADARRAARQGRAARAACQGTPCRIAAPICAPCGSRCAIPARRWRWRRSCWSPCRSPTASSAAASSSSPRSSPTTAR